MPLSVGDVAPEIVLPLKPGEAPLRLSDYRGQKSVVILFFPQAFSSVCTAEMCQIAEDYTSWKDMGVEIIGICVDSPNVTVRFAREVGAAFPILSDFNRTAMEAYGVRNDDFFGLRGVANRSVFVVDREGRIVYSWSSEDADMLPDFDAVREAVREAR